MKRLLFLLLLVSTILANSFGFSRIQIERTWTIGGADGGPIDFKGALVVNNTNQGVVSAEAGDGASLMQDEDGTIWVLYRGRANRSDIQISGKAIVDVSYDTDISHDPPVPKDQLSYTNLTEADDAISLQAEKLATRNSSLRTIASLVNFVHESVEYDVSYWGEVESAKDVFRDRRGVCVEYTHLLISMARSLGLQTRYASGYVHANSWQPHAWAEIYVPGYGYLPADATFAQVGILDSSHLTIDYGDDQAGVYDLLLSQNPNATLMVRDSISTSFSDEEEDPAPMDISFDSLSYTFDVLIVNPRDEYLFGTYDHMATSGIDDGGTSVLLLEPGQRLHVYHGLNHSLFGSGYSYSIPAYASFNDADASMMVSIHGDSAISPSVQGRTCIAASILLGMVFLGSCYLE